MSSGRSFIQKWSRAAHAAAEKLKKNERKSEILMIESLVYKL